MSAVTRWAALRRRLAAGASLPRAVRLPAAGAMAVAVLLVVAAAIPATTRTPAVVLGVLGLAALAGVLAVPRPSSYPVALGLLAGAGVVPVLAAPAPDLGAVPVAGALMAVHVTATWALDRRSAVPEPPPVVARRVATAVACVVGAMLLALVLLLAADLPAPAGLGPEIVGLLAATVLVALFALRRWGRRPDR